MRGQPERDLDRTGRKARPTAHPRRRAPGVRLLLRLSGGHVRPGAERATARAAGARGVAIEQASPFSEVCDVWAPAYRQVTTAGLWPSLGSGASPSRIAYDDVRAAFDTFLADHRGGRRIVFIGHSQGAAILIDPLQQQVDPNPRLRATMLSAILLGGNVQVPDEKVAGATFKHLPLCLHPAQRGCVLAYSSFDRMPPPNNLFGIPGRGVGLLSGQRSDAGQQVACVDPARFDPGVAASLEPYFATLNPTATSAAWVT
jgi:hypothetical protein